VAISAGVRPGESVVILTDRDRPPAVAAALAQVVDEIGATPIVLTMPALPSGAEPPQPVTAAMARADVILAPTSGAIYHTESVRDATTQGARFLALTAFTEDVLMRGGVFADFPTVGHRAERLAALITAATHAHVTTAAGTDLRVSLDGRTAVPITGMIREPGDRSACPDIEAFIAPLETSGEGVVVADASASIAGVLAEPVRLTIERGRAVSIEGGEAAALITAALDAAADEHAYTLAELAFGLNPDGIIRGVIVEDEGVAGTGHVALGSNRFFGGTSAAPIHLDFVFHRPSLWLDGHSLMEHGRFVEGSGI
jgi:leucyl aminopeptidase (aminopeptidase T)